MKSKKRKQWIDAILGKTKHQPFHFSHPNSLKITKAEHFIFISFFKSIQFANDSAKLIHKSTSTHSNAPFPFYSTFFPHFLLHFQSNICPKCDLPSGIRLGWS
jgi:hypothetical protein